MVKRITSIHRYDEIPGSIPGGGNDEFFFSSHHCSDYIKAFIYSYFAVLACDRRSKFDLLHIFAIVHAEHCL